MRGNSKMIIWVRLTAFAVLAYLSAILINYYYVSYLIIFLIFAAVIVIYICGVKEGSQTAKEQ